MKERQTCLVQPHVFFSKSVLEAGITLAKCNTLLNFCLFLVGKEISLTIRHIVLFRQVLSSTIMTERRKPRGLKTVIAVVQSLIISKLLPYIWIVLLICLLSPPFLPINQKLRPHHSQYVAATHTFPQAALRLEFLTLHEPDDALAPHETLTGQHLHPHSVSLRDNLTPKTVSKAKDRWGNTNYKDPNRIRKH